MATSTRVKIGGKSLSLSNLDKVFYPQADFRKAQVIDYYARAARVLLPHLKHRPLTLKRYPDGALGSHFYQKQCPLPRPSWLSIARVQSEGSGAIDYCVVNDLASLVWVVNLASIELHPSLSKVRPAKLGSGGREFAQVGPPSFVAFDLDPGPPADVLSCCQVAIWLKELLEPLGLQSFPKTSGSKGLQVYVPLNRATDYAATKSFAKAIAETLARQRPDAVVSKMTKQLRTGKVLVDWSQNDEHKTTVCVYSLRARELPWVSAPLTWSEVSLAFQKRDSSRLQFTAEQVLRRVEEQGDLFAPVLQLTQALPRL